MGVMKKHSPASIDINLLPKDPFFATPLGRILQWALSAGRYIVIFTELVVILSFVARFTLDRQLTDLNGSINQKKNMIESFGTLEQDFKLAQKKIDNYKQINQSVNLVEVFAHLSEVTPQDVEITSLAILPSTINISANTVSQASFNTFINNLQLSPDFMNISVGTVETREDKTAGFQFKVSADTKVIAIEAPNKASQEERQNILDRTQGL